MLDHPLESIDPLLGAPAPAVGRAEAEAILLAHFGIAAHATALSSERDGNFRMRAADGKDYLLKFSSAAEEPAVTNLQTGALRHLERHAPHLPVPRILASRAGRDETVVSVESGERHIVRLMSYLPGEPLAGVAAPAIYRPLVAPMLAQLDLGLAGFDHAAASRRLLWDASDASGIRPLIQTVSDKPRRHFLARLLDAYDDYAVPRLPALRTQIIHNDFNPSNILADAAGPARLTGIIDFGDIIRAPLVSEVATAASYQPIDDGDPLDILCGFVAGYHRAMALTPRELDVLLDLIRARQIMVLAITEWRAARHPENSAYILRNNPRAWRCLQAFGAMSRSDVQRALRRACGMENDDE